MLLSWKNFNGLRCRWKIKKWPWTLVTLNEFEPAAGIEVQKIINLSDDIARNTSSESQELRFIPGSNTIGIELPNASRENVYLSEILDKADFKKDIKLPIALGKNISGTQLLVTAYASVNCGNNRVE